MKNRINLIACRLGDIKLQVVDTDHGFMYQRSFVMDDILDAASHLHKAVLNADTTTWRSNELDADLPWFTTTYSELNSDVYRELLGIKRAADVALWTDSDWKNCRHMAALIRVVDAINGGTIIGKLAEDA